MMDIKSPIKGFLPPRVALIALNAAAPVLSPALGLLVFNTDTSGVSPNNVVPGYYYWGGTKWCSLAGSPADSIMWKGNDSNVFLEDIAKKVGIGTSSPDESLSVFGTLDFGNVLVVTGKKRTIFRQSENTPDSRGNALKNAFRFASDNSTIIVGQGDYAMDSSLIIKNFQLIEMQNSTIYSNAELPMFITYASYWKLSGMALLVGTMTNKGVIMGDDFHICTDWEISGMAFYQFNRAIDVNISVGKIINNSFGDNFYGIYISADSDHGSDYNSIKNNLIINSAFYGVYILSGNCLV
ncbi:MAG: hypothetical protein WCJ95_21805 [Mariniphaga sp.]